MDSIKTKLLSKFGEKVKWTDSDLYPHMITVDVADLLDVTLFIKEVLFFDQLSCITALESETSRYEVHYQLYSIPDELSMSVVVALTSPVDTVPSLTRIWPSADWMEREAYDMVGICFGGHPDMRRILLPDDWVGHPLSKSYQEQEFYHGIKVKY